MKFIYLSFNKKPCIIESIIFWDALEYDREKMNSKYHNDL